MEAKLKIEIAEYFRKKDQERKEIGERIQIRTSKIVTFQKPIGRRIQL